MAISDTDRELKLIKAARQGDTVAMREIYDSHIRYLTAVCARYVTNQEDLKDVLQESFLKVYSAIDSFEFRGNGSLRGWITRIAVNQAIRHIKQSGRLTFSELTEENMEIADEEPELEGVPASAIHTMIGELPVGYRTIFNLYVLEQRSHKEIAAMLNIKESSSASQLHRAKALLADKIIKYRKSH